MWKQVGWLSGVTVAVVALLILRPGPEPVADAERVDAARRALQPFKQGLMGALQEGLAQGPEAAIDACRLEAPRIAKSLASESVRVGRTSHRLRNPANAPKPWMQPILEELRTSTPGEIVYRTADIDAGWLGYAEPIYVQPLCLSCHGEHLAPSVSSRIRKTYPEDRATGFALGDFRGLFWIELAHKHERE